jgi:colanic acid/amylovoran biosynthesis glycosyltransferase
MRVAYLVNQYPMVSHSFIRREILALEKSGISVLRIALRGWNYDPIDEQDRRERESTNYVLQGGAFGLLYAFIRTMLTRPLRFLKALALATRMGRRADRPLLVHLIYLAEACFIEAILRDGQVEHLHAHFGTNPAEIAMLVHVLGGPLWSFTVHGPEEFDKPQFIGLSEKIRRSAFVVAISSYGRSQLYRCIEHQQWSKIHVVHCGLERAFMESASSPISAHRLVCVGRLCEQKGQLLLLDAVHKLAEQGTQIELVLAGDGEMRPDIEQLIKKYRMEKIVRITGWISTSQVRDEILASRALVLPSFAEGLPVVIMEAMALRRTIISTFVAGIPELVLPAHGWLVPAGDLEALVRAIGVCLEKTEDELAVMGEAAHRRVVERHSVDKEAAKLINLFRSSARP